MYSSSRVTIIDYGAGNLSSVYRFFKDDLGLDTSVSSIGELSEGDSHTLVIPGVGHFETAAKRLQLSEGYERISAFAKEGKLVLGICLGAQILTLRSEEGHPGVQGIGLLPIECCSLKNLASYEGKTPRTGWATVNHRNREDGSYYFVHSYYMSSASSADSALNIDVCDKDKVPAYVSLKDYRVHAMQFHPEKSAESGYRFVKEIIENA